LEKKRRKKSENKFVDWFFGVGFREQEEELRETKEGKNEKKTIKHRPDKFSFFNLFRSFSASNTSLDGIIDPQ
jgi:hypothetical protein